MSGPKTSQLEIERMIRAQLEALRSDVDHSRARARRRIAALLNELLDEAEGCAEAEEAAASLRQLAEAALEQLTAECAFTPATAMAESVARTERCSSRAVAIADAFEREAHPPGRTHPASPRPSRSRVRSTRLHRRAGRGRQRERHSGRCGGRPLFHGR